MITRILLLLVLSTFSASAAGTVPSEASVKELLATMQVRKTLDNLIPQVDGAMKQSFAQAMQGHPLTAAQQKAFDKNHDEAMAVMKEMLDWTKLEPMYVRIYQKSLTQEEVTGMIAMYKTPAGQAMINKVPLVVQNTMVEMQQMMAPIMEHLQTKQNELVTQIKAEPAPKAN